MRNIRRSLWWLPALMLASSVLAADVQVAGPSPGSPPGSTVTALADGRIVIIGGGSTNIWIPRDRHWISDARAAQMTRRSYHSATLDGPARLVLAGGVDMTDYRGRQTALASSTVWNAGTDAWEAGPGLLEPRIAHAAVALGAHDILVCGGSSSADHARPVAPMLASVERLGERTTVALKPMLEARAYHAALSLADGRVLVIGGLGNDASPLASTEIFDPQRNDWSRGPNLNQARAQHSASLLADGRVLVAGGLDARGQPLASAEIWTPGSDRWLPAGELAQARSAHDAVVLPDGDVLISSGETRAQHPAQVLERWHAADGRWWPAGYLPFELRQSHAVLASNGRVLIFGQDSYAGASAFAWLPDVLDTPSVDAPLRGTLTALRDGRFMLAGGQRRQSESSAVQIYDPATRRWQSAQPLHHLRSGHQAIALRDGRVLVLGGRIADAERDRGGEAPQFAVEIWDPASGGWSDSRSLRYPSDNWNTPSLLADGRVSLSAIEPLNGYSLVLGYVRIWNPRQDELSPLLTLVRPWRGGKAVLLADGGILYTGGAQPEERRTDRWDPLGSIWQPLAAAPVNLADHQLRALADGRALAWKSRQAGNSLEMWLWRPEAGWSALADAPIAAGLGPIEAYSLPRNDVLLVAAGIESWVWNSFRQIWERIAHDQPWNDTLLVNAGADGEVLAFHGTDRLERQFPSLVVSRLDLAEHRWQPDAGAYLPREHPTLIDLGTGSVMVAAGGTAVVQLWNARGNEWQLAPFLPRPLLQASGARLPDGRVLLAGMERTNDATTLYCYLRQPTSGAWSECGRFPVEEHESYAHILVRALDAGRVLLVYGKQHAMIWQEPEGWSATKLQLPQNLNLPASAAQGTPYLTPLGSVWDPRDNAWIDATDAFFDNALGLSTARLRDDSVLAIREGTVYRWDPRAKTLRAMTLSPAPEDRALNTLVVTAPDCIVAWNGGTRQSLPVGVRAAMPTLLAGDLGAGAWRGNPDLSLSPLNAGAIGLADGTVLLAGTGRLPASPAGAAQRIHTDCRSIEPLDTPRDFHFPTAASAQIQAGPAGAATASAHVAPFRPAPFAQRWMQELRAQWLALPRLWPLKAFAVLVVLWPLLRYTQRWESYVPDESGRMSGRRIDAAILALAVPAWILLAGLPNTAWKLIGCVLLALPALISARRLWLNAAGPRHRGWLAMPLAGAWFMALVTIGNVSAQGVTRWFAFITGNG